jgi:hypothetical protein
MMADPITLPEVTPELVLDALGTRQWAATGVVARALLPDGGHGIPHRLRREHHERVREVLRQLCEDDRVRFRWVPVQGAPGDGRKEWRRTT